MNYDLKDKTLTICGSMRFAAAMSEQAKFLELNFQANVIQPIYGVAFPTEQELDTLSRLHFRKIDLSDGIYVVDGADGYIGEHTKKEIQYAEQNGKEVIYHSAFVQDFLCSKSVVK